MTPVETIILNFEEIRRRSIKLWSALTPDVYDWRPDIQAMSCLEMVRHVLEGEYIYHTIINKRGHLGDFTSPWADRPYTTLQDELNFVQPYREAFFKTVQSFSAQDLDEIEIIRIEKGQRRKLGDYLQRIAYHEAVHSGQMLAYLRTLGIDRPQIWD